jgi:divinyl protochlorophyllide a 8-vinyl-reductase
MLGGHKAGSKLQRPPQGYLGPLAVSQLLVATEQLCGREARDALCRDAKMTRTPAWNEPVPEEKVARLHQSLRRLYPDFAEQVARLAGQKTADYILDKRMPGRALRLLSSTPKSIAVWLLTRAARQHSWAFHGSGTFIVHKPLEYEVLENPITSGEHAHGPVCHYHAAAFERLFQRLVDPALRCREVACRANGAPSCRFVFEMAAPARVLH